MQESKCSDHGPAGRTAPGRAGRHRGRDGSAGRGRYVLMTTALFAGFGIAGVSAVDAANDTPPPGDTAAVDLDLQARAAEAAARTDRSARTTPAPARPAPSKAPPGTSKALSGASKTPRTSAPARSRARARPPATARPAWVNPMPTARVTSCFGPRWGALHAGIDLAAPAGTPVRAAGTGRVVTAGYSYGGYGLSVLVDHGDGYLTHYGHLATAVVAAGQRVSAGQPVGREGSTGDSTGPHLHFEVHQGLWKQVDPAPWLRARGVRLGC